MQAVWTVDQARLIDEMSINNDTKKQMLLMQRAGRAVAKTVLECSHCDDRILILVGKGNNGGDARLVEQIVSQLRPKVHLLNIHEEWDSSILDGHDKLIVVDGIFGLGFRPPLTDTRISSCIAAVNSRTNTFVIAIDVPSGISGDATIANDRACILRADKCITFGALKPVHCFLPELCGETIVEDIGFEERAIEAVRRKAQDWQYASESVSGIDTIWSKHLRNDAHKFTRGHVLILGGSKGKLGAPIWSAGAAAASGCGWVSVAIPLSARSNIFLPMQYTYEDLFDGTAPSAARVKEFLATRNVATIVIGPGMMKHEHSPTLSADLWDALCDFSFKGGSVVIDAGACSGLLDHAQRNPANPGKILATPHPGEWLTLSLRSPLTMFANATQSFEILRRAQESGISLCFKGATPTIFSANRSAPIVICKGNDPRLAKAGTGDLLAGITAALAVPSRSIDEAFCSAYMHLRAVASRLSSNLANYSYTAADFLQGLRSKQ